MVPRGSEPLGDVAGILVQRLPEGDDAAVEEARRRIAGGAFRRALEAGAGAQEAIREIAGDGFDLLADVEVAYRCGCSHERARVAVSALGPDGVADVLAKEREAVVTCEFCRSRYVVKEPELREIEARGAGGRGLAGVPSDPRAGASTPTTRTAERVVDSGRRRPPASSRRRAIPTAKKTKAASGRSRGRRAAAGRKQARRRGPPTPDTQPLGVGVADAFAIQRLTGRRRRPKKPVRELGWAAFGEVARALSADIARKFRPSVVIGIAKGGVFAGSAIATAVGAEFYPVRIERRRRDTAPLAEAMTTIPALTGKRVLVVDDVARTGATLARARALAKKAGAKEVRTAVLVTRPHGARPDFAAMETDQLVLFAWDYQLDDGASGGGDPGEVGV